MIHICNLLRRLFSLLYNEMHKHNPIEDNGEIVCRECGIVLDREEVIEDYRDPHGKATLWQYGLGGINKGKREDISIISNVCQRLNLTEAISYEVLISYQKYVKSDNDRLLALKLAILDIIDRYGIKISRRDAINIVELNFGKNDKRLLYNASIASKLASIFGAKLAVKITEEVINAW